MNANTNPNHRAVLPVLVHVSVPSMVGRSAALDKTIKAPINACCVISASPGEKTVCMSLCSWDQAALTRANEDKRRLS